MKPEFRVLIVDDSLIARRQLLSELNALGMKDIIEAGNGEEGLKALAEAHLEKKTFNLIITDLRMPNLSGIAFLTRLKSDPDFQNIPKIICSVESDRGMLLNAVLSGADSYILKPVTQQVLREKIEKVIARRKAG